MTDTATAWNTYARQRPERRQTNRRGETTWFNWTQYPDHGPGHELLELSPGDHAIDLGCGKGGNAAHLATLGVQTVGVDLSTAQLAAAHERWGTVQGLTLVRADAISYLQSAERFDAVYSVFGAAWFTDPVRWLSVVREQLRPGGRLVFSQRPPVEDCYGCQTSYIPRGDDEDPLVVKRWDFDLEAWERMLLEYGYRDVRVEVLAAPPGPRTVGTLLASCRR